MSFFYVFVGLDHDPSVLASHTTDITGASHHPQQPLLLEIGSHELFAQAVLKL
jgi:hypothetical protein